MTILGNNSAKLNEVIFANRNKNYGAYAIRSDYNDSILKSLGLLACMVLTLFGSVAFMNRNHNNIENQKVVLIDDLDSVISFEYKIDPPKQPEIIQSPAIDNAAAAPSGGVPIIIDNAAITTSVNLTNPIMGQGTSTATGTSQTSILESTITAVTYIEIHKEPVDNTDHIIAEEMPEFNTIPNGILLFVSGNIVYPPLAREIGREGIVHVSFIVNQTGDVEGVKILKGIGYGCDEEVMRVINKMPTWKKPGKNNGKAVRVRYNIPVSFKLR